MSLQQITQDKFWTLVVRESKDLSTRVHMAHARHEAIQLYESMGCHIDYFLDTQHDAIVYQPYIGYEEEQ